MKDKIRAINGDCLSVMQKMIDDGESFHSLISDPPYHLTSIVKRFSKEKPSKAKSHMTAGKNAAPQYKRLSRGFMGHEWDGGDIAFRKETWELGFKLLKPGAHLCAFSATRNYHRMACAIEDAGFEIRDMLSWNYGTGFPKSHKVEVTGFEGFGTALKPGFEPIVFARKPIEGTVNANVEKYGTGGINIDGCRIGEGTGEKPKEYKPNDKNKVFGRGMGGGNHDDSKGRFPCNIMHDGSKEVTNFFPDGSARFFYSAKADKQEKIDREDSHPTVKPVDLMSWLCRLITPPGGRILDPFGGTGSTGIGGALEGFNVTLIERDPGYYKDILTRIERTTGDDLPMFSGKPAQSVLI